VALKLRLFLRWLKTLISYSKSRIGSFGLKFAGMEHHIFSNDVIDFYLYSLCIALAIYQTSKTRCGLSHQNFDFFHLMCNRTAWNCPVPLKLVVMLQQRLFYSLTEF
jgi:hypothetical protein